MANRYLVSFDLQKDAISALCFKTCGKVLIGIIEIQGMAFLPCPEKVCPYLDSQLSEPTLHNHQGHDYYLRKLQDGPYA
ncbi:MAG: hypothetical protein K0B06_04060 [Brevefilum sp.]|nr:hypothetical protein [Brevefilum sp.]